MPPGFTNALVLKPLIDSAADAERDIPYNIWAAGYPQTSL